jgi:hypothetical protein
MDALALSRKKASNSESILCLISKMGHGNLKERPEWFAFADSVLNDGRPWIREKSTSLNNGNISATFESKTPIGSRQLPTLRERPALGSEFTQGQRASGVFQRIQGHVSQASESYRHRIAAIKSIRAGRALLRVA